MAMVDSPHTKLFRLSVYDEKHFVLSFESLDAETHNLAHDRVVGFPERRYRKSLGAWIIPFTEATFDYLFEEFEECEYELDDDASIVARYQVAARRSLSAREKRRWDYIFDGVVPSIDYVPATVGFNHQTVGLDAWHGAEEFGLLFETGTGKTWVAINEARWSADEQWETTFKEKRGRGTSYKMLVACPKSLRLTWVYELVKHLPTDYPYWVKPVRAGAIYATTDCINFLKEKEYRLKILICSYEQINTLEEQLKKLKFDLFVCDESTHIKNPSAKRSRACFRVGQTCRRRAILTGTPIANNVLDLFSQFRFLQEGALGYDSYKAFKERYARLARTDSGWEQITGFRNIEELKQRMARLSFVVRKKDCLDLPPKIFQIHPIEMGERQQLIYDEMVEHCVVDLDTHEGEGGIASAEIILTQILRLSQICSGFINTEESGCKPIPDGDVKLQFLRELIQSIGPSNRFIIWSRFTWVVDRVLEVLEDMEVSHGELKGRTSEKQRARNVLSFNDPEGIQVIVGDPGCAGYGLTLLGTEERPCSDVIYMDNDWSALKRQQSADRAHRIGTLCPVTYHDLVCEDSVDLRIAEALIAKQELGNIIKDYSSMRRLLVG